MSVDGFASDYCVQDDPVETFVGLPKDVRGYLVKELKLSKRLAGPLVSSADVSLDDLLSPLHMIPSMLEKSEVYRGIRRGLKDVCELKEESFELVYRPAALVILPYALQMHAAVRF